MAQGMYQNLRGPLSEGSRQQIMAAWEQAMAEHADSPQVLLNAASFLERTDPERALGILQKAKTLSAAPGPEYAERIALIYAAAELAALDSGGKLNNIEMSRESVEKLRGQLQSSGDPALLAATGKILVQLSEHNTRGLELIQQAIRLDPGNAEWTEALQSAEAEPQRRLNYQQLMKAQRPQPGTPRISSHVADANLVSKVDPVYPPRALAARIREWLNSP
jgi:tetratricopeptide (TPR) repeat protein